ncbi:universal stress protein [Hippea maritima]|uniref:UspA domain-containing protein n=1 Tax=Hippea maritima (strain ATCC 700847 / DSM 10411 / MH2) TaxID=760142 RepID=F2LXP9_HIPMA|nr:universal stress protein [Hippea maritima]AEA34290.1 UspA domain-containing protein [Hippea maritima DSM 10411]
MKIENILACVDSSDYGVSVMRFSSYFAKILKSKLTGLHVIDIVQLEGPFMYDISGALGLEPFIDFSSKVRDVLRQKGENILSAFEGIAKEYGIDFKKAMDFGVVPNVIVDFAKDHDLIFMGKKGVNEQYERGILGIVAETVIRRIEKPLFVAPKHFYTFKEIIACVDSREPSMRAYSMAKELSKLFGVKLSCVYVKGKAPTPQIDGVEVVEGDTVADSLEEFINQRERPLVCIGAYAKSKLLEMVLGSTTEALLRKDEDNAFLVVR